MLVMFYMKQVFMSTSDQYTHSVNQITQKPELWEFPSLVWMSDVIQPLKMDTQNILP